MHISGLEMQSCVPQTIQRALVHSQIKKRNTLPKHAGLDVKLNHPPVVLRPAVKGPKEGNKVSLGASPEAENIIEVPAKIWEPLPKDPTNG